MATVKELDAQYGDVEGYPASGTKKDKQAFVDSLASTSEPDARTQDEATLEMNAAEEADTQHVRVAEGSVTSLSFDEEVKASQARQETGELNQGYVREDIASQHLSTPPQVVPVVEGAVSSE